MTFRPFADLRGPQLGDCLDVMGSLADESVCALITDPPYGIRFMGKAWDRIEINEEAAKELERKERQAERGEMPMRLTGDRDGRGARKLIPRSGSAFSMRAAAAGSYDFTPKGTRAFQAWCETWGAEALRVLKPGGHAVVFGYGRTYHRLVAGLEDAGFEIRDTLLWLFGQGFPKSRNLGDGWGTQLKPAFEPIVLARKPFKGTVDRCHAEHGTGALNIDACRIEGAKGDGNWTGRDEQNNGWFIRDQAEDHPKSEHGGGRWPANLLLDEAAAEMLDEQSGISRSSGGAGERSGLVDGNVYGTFSGENKGQNAGGLGDVGGASRFFYCGKTRPGERHAGVDRELFPDGNDHPTVKPLEVMRWLLRLVVPPGGLVLDPFLGSGTTACAAALEGFEFVGSDEDAHYLQIAEQRIAYWSGRPAQLELAS